MSKRIIPVKFWINSHGEAWGEIGSAMVRIKQIAGPSLRVNFGEEIRLVGVCRIVATVKSS